MKSRLPLLLLLLAALFICGCDGKEPAPTAVGGKLDLSGWDFDQNGLVDLDGEWEFYEGRLLDPDAFPPDETDARGRYAVLPNLWKSYRTGSRDLPSRGVATYRLTVKAPPGGSRWALMISRPLSVAKVWINGRLAGRTGEVGSSEESESPERHMVFCSFPTTRDSFTIVLQISNHHNMQGGLNDPIMFGPEEMLQHAAWRSYTVTAFICGCLFIMAVIHLLLFVLRRSEPANLYFGLYCLLQAVGRMTGDMRVCPLEIVFPDLPWRLGIDLAVVSMIVSIPFLVMFYQAIFPWKHGRTVERFYGAVAAGLVLYVAATPANAYDTVLVFFSMAAFTAFPYIAWRLVMDLARRREGVGILVPGYLVLAVVLSIDLLFEFHIFETIRLVPFALLFFVLSYSFLISVRYARTFSSLKAVSSALTENNRELSRQIRKKENALLREKREKLQKLRYQLNPHFLFNSLASIRGAISLNPSAALGMMTHLSDFCRITLTGGDMDLLTVGEEIETIRHYLAMEQMRLGDYLRLSITMVPGSEKMKVPAFILHPLVENAVKYGSRTSPDTLELAVRTSLPSPGTLEVTVCNTGEWVAPEAVDEKRSTGTGLNNVRERLKQYYRDAFVFDIGKDGGRVCIKLTFPGAPPEEPDRLRGRRGYGGGEPK